MPSYKDRIHLKDTSWYQRKVILIGFLSMSKLAFAMMGTVNGNCLGIFGPILLALTVLGFI